MRTLLRLSALVGLLICVSGCGLLRPTRVVIVDASSDIVRLGNDVEGTVYLYESGGWKRVGPVRLPEGWYAGPMPAQ